MSAPLVLACLWLIAANVLAYERGARIFRVHDVAEAHQALTVASATLQRHGPA